MLPITRHIRNCNQTSYNQRDAVVRGLNSKSHKEISFKSLKKIQYKKKIIIKLKLPAGNYLFQVISNCNEKMRCGTGNMITI